MERLEEQPIPHLSPNEQQSLLVLVQTTLEVRPSGSASMHWFIVFAD